MFSAPYFSVIIPTRNRLGSLANCLAHLSPNAQTLREVSYETIVTDDSTDLPAREMIAASFPWATWVAGPQRGPAANRNNGAHHAAGKWLVFIDDDCLPDPRLLSSYFAVANAASPAKVLEGRIYADRPKRSSAEMAPINESGNCLYSCNFSIFKATYEAVGGFDERFPYAAMEDLDFRIRLREHGSVVIFVRDAAVCHPWRYAAGWQYLERTNQSVLLYISLHPEERVYINAKFYAKHSVHFLVQAMKGLHRCDWPGLRWSILSALSAGKLAFMLYRHTQITVVLCP